MATPLLPVSDPNFTLKEACKQLLLLEDHLSNPRKRCPDCIRKHLLTAEGLAEEAIGLGANPFMAQQAEKVAKTTRAVSAYLEGGGSFEKAAAAIRSVRKELVGFCYAKPKPCLTCKAEAKQNPATSGSGLLVGAALLGVLIALSRASTQ